MFTVMHYTVKTQLVKPETQYYDLAPCHITFAQEFTTMATQSHLQTVVFFQTSFYWIILQTKLIGHFNFLGAIFQIMKARSGKNLNADS